MQSLIKKHFPAPGNRIEELFGLDSDVVDGSSPTSRRRTPVKRKKKGQLRNETLMEEQCSIKVERSSHLCRLYFVAVFKSPKPKKVKSALERIYNCML